MLNTIKSIFCKKIFFSYIDEKVKLSIIKYNKSLQNTLVINIINYKLISEKHIVYITKNEGKEYSSYYNKLLYEGEYLNGKRHGKGKEYDEIYDYIKYEGEYLN